MDGSLGQVQAHRVLLTALVQLLDDLRVAGFFARARRRVGPFYRAVQGEGHRGRSAARLSSRLWHLSLWFWISLPLGSLSLESLSLPRVLLMAKAPLPNGTWDPQSLTRFLSL